MSGTSNVGQASVYEAGDQRNVKQSEIDEQKKEQRFEEGKENSHNNQDPKDERPIKRRLEAESKKEDEDNRTFEEKLIETAGATAPAKAHGNKPSKGAVIDEQIQREEQEELERKGKA